MDEEEREAVLPAPPADLGSWTEGTERYASVPEDQIDRCLGLDDSGGFIPGFNRKEDPNGLTDPWTPEGRAELEKDTAVPLTLRWHQKVGVLRMQEQLYAGKPLLLMDEVGVGKTAQAIAAIAKYAYDRAYYSRCMAFPGMFSTCHDVLHATADIDDNLAGDTKLPDNPHGNLPARPHIIVCPVNLVDQWTSELHRWLEHGAFSVLPYVGACTLANRTAFWQSWDSLDSPMDRRIILASTSVSTTAPSS